MSVHESHIRVIIRWFFVSTAIVAVGCNVGSTKELSGDYSVNYMHGTEKLTLRTNGTFTQIYSRLGDGVSTANSGTRTFDKNRGHIVLRDVLVFNEGQGGEARREQLLKGVWQIQVAKCLGDISLIIGEPGVLEFDKVE